jgi:hypothetical protein
MRKQFLVFFGGCILLFGCSKSSKNEFVPKDEWQKYMVNQIDSLLIINPTVVKNITTRDLVENEVLNLPITREKWMDELGAFLMVDFSTEKEKSKLQHSIDSAGKNSIENYYSNDTNAYLQSFSIHKTNNKIQLLQWQLKKRTFLMDRDVQMSYQPLKGYRIQINENALWNSPKQIEIFAEIQNNNDLRR